MDIGLNAKAKMDYIHHLLPYLLHWTYRGILFRHAKIEHFLFSDTLFLDFFTCKQLFFTLGTTESTDSTESMNFWNCGITRRGAGTMDFWEPRITRIARNRWIFRKGGITRRGAEEKEEEPLTGKPSRPGTVRMQRTFFSLSLKKVCFWVVTVFGRHD